MLSDPLQNMATFGLGKLFPNAGAVTRTLGGLALNMGGEGLEEVLEGVAANKAVGDPNDWSELGYEGLLGALSGGLFGGGGMAVNAAVNALTKGNKSTPPAAETGAAQAPTDPVAGALEEIRREDDTRQALSGTERAELLRWAHGETGRMAEEAQFAEDGTPENPLSEADLVRYQEIQDAMKRRDYAALSAMRGEAEDARNVAQQDGEQYEQQGVGPAQTAPRQAESTGARGTVRTRTPAELRQLAKDVEARMIAAGHDVEESKAMGLLASEFAHRFAERTGTEAKDALNIEFRRGKAQEKRGTQGKGYAQSSTRQSEEYDPGDPKTWPVGAARDEALALEAWQNFENDDEVETWPESPEKTRALELQKESRQIDAWIENLPREEFDRRLRSDDPEFVWKNERGTELENELHALRKSLRKGKPKGAERRLLQLIEAEEEAAAREAEEEYYQRQAEETKNIRHGRAAMEKVIAEHTDVMDATLKTLPVGWGAPNGRTYFLPDGTSIIDFFETANKSTSFHEFGHHILNKVMEFSGREGVDPQMAKDVETILKEVHVSRKSFDADIKNARRRAHEFFARGFEKYLAEGKAPTKTLRDVFSRIRNWMIEVYERIANIPGKQLSDEMRGVYDRLFASDGAFGDVYGAEDVKAGTNAPAQTQEMVTTTTRKGVEVVMRRASSPAWRTAETDAVAEELERKMLAVGKDREEARVFARVGASVAGMLARRANISPADAMKLTLRRGEDAVQSEGFAQPVNAGVDLGQKVPILDLSGKLEDAKKATPQELFAFLKAEFIGREPNISSDGEALIGIPSNSAARHVVRSSRKGLTYEDMDTRTAGLLSLREVLQNARLIESHKNQKDNKKHLKNVHRFYIPVWSSDGLKTLRVVAHERKSSDGRIPVEVDLNDVIIEGASRNPARLSGTPLSGVLPERQLRRVSEITIADMLRGVKDAEGRPYVGEEYRQIGTKRKNEMDASLAKHRPDLTPEQRTDAISEIEKLGEEVKAGGSPKHEKAATKWLLGGHIILPEDNYKILDALKICEQQHLDPMSFGDPNEILAKYTIKESAAEKRVNPDTVSELSDKKEYPDGITVYTVQNDKAGQAAVRKIIDTHWGEDANPWCLAARGKRGGMTDAWRMWRNYDSIPKRIAFQNGKLLAFCASDKEETQWWDREDESFPAIPYRLGKGDGVIYGYHEDLGHSSKVKEKLKDGTIREFYPSNQIKRIPQPAGKKTAPCRDCL